jgi:rod shape-determining protein MreB
MGLLRRLLPRSACQIAIDLGTANTLVHLRGKGIVLREPSVVAVESASGAVLEVGEKAKQMLGKTPPGIRAVRPLKDGVIADFEAAEALLRHFLDRVRRRRMWPVPAVVAIAVPSGVTEVERRAVRDAALRAGADEVRLIEETLAAAIGAELPVWEASGRMVVDIGGGSSAVAVISLNAVASRRSIRVAGDEIDEAVVAYLQREFSLAIGTTAAERVKLQVGSAWPRNGDERTTEVRGRDLATGLPRAAVVSSGQIREAMARPLREIAEAVREALEETPPELGTDIMQAGILLTGGGALLPGMDLLLQHQGGMPVKVAESPLTCVVLGAGRALQERARFQEAFASS